MNRFKLNTILLAALAGVSSLAQAGPLHPPGASSTTVHAKVTDVRPVYREVRVSTPVQECWEEPVTRHHHVQHGGDRTAATLAGGLLGGIIGNQFGKGRGRKASTAIGTIIGAQIGHGSALGGPTTTTSYTSYERHCSEHERVSYEQELEGYRVTYRYRGREYQTRMPYDPGDRLELKVTVEPVF